MKRMLVGITILLAGVVGYGFYKGWFVVSAGESGHEADVTLTVDRDKVRADEKKLEDAGYKPSLNDPNYPQNLQDAQKKANAAGASQ